MGKLSITPGEYKALNFIEGLNEEAFQMVMGAKKTPKGNYILQGKPETFEELSNDLSDEIYYKLSPDSRLSHLKKLHDRLSPECEY